MITDIFLQIGFWLFDLLLGFMDSLPEVPSELMAAVNLFTSFIGNGISALNCFLDLDFIMGAIPVWLAIAAFDKLYHIVMWVLRKIPVLGID